MIESIPRYPWNTQGISAVFSKKYYIKIEVLWHKVTTIKIENLLFKEQIP